MHGKPFRERFFEESLEWEMQRQVYMYDRPSIVHQTKCGEERV